MDREFGCRIWWFSISSTPIVFKNRSISRWQSRGITKSICLITYEWMDWFSSWWLTRQKKIHCRRFIFTRISLKNSSTEIWIILMCILMKILKACCAITRDRSLAWRNIMAKKKCSIKWQKCWIISQPWCPIQLFQLEKSLNLRLAGCITSRENMTSSKRSCFAWWYERMSRSMKSCNMPITFHSSIHHQTMQFKLSQSSKKLEKKIRIILDHRIGWRRTI